MLILILNLLIF